MQSILQRDLKDCGVSCLEYIIEFYHGYVPIEKLREDTFTSQNGTTAYHLVETLKKYQFDSYGEKTTYEGLNEIILPAIVHVILQNGMHHFVVLTKVTSKNVRIMDPASGTKTLSRVDFEHIWDGVVLVAVPSAFIPKIPKEPSIFEHLFAFVKQEKKLFILCILFGLGIAILSIFVSFYLKIGMNYGFYLEKKEFYRLIFCFGFFYFLKFCFTVIKEKILLFLDKNIDTTYMYSFISHLFNLPVLKFQSYHIAEIQTRIDEAREVKDLFLHICVTFFLECILGICCLVFLFWMEWHLSFFLTIGMGFYVLLGLFLAHPYYRVALEQMETKKIWNEMILEKLQMFFTMKHLNQIHFVLEDFEKELCETETKWFLLKKRARILQFVRDFFLEVFYFCVMSYGMILIFQDQLSLYDFFVFQSLYFYFVTPLQELCDILPEFCYLRGILSKISEAMNLEEEEIHFEQNPIPVPSITVKNLSYSYNDVSEQVQNINFKVKAKEHVFLDGPSGSGKSTVCRILEKEMTGYLGKILLSDKDLEDYTLSEIRASIVYLSQSEMLFNGTIRENILYGSYDLSSFDEVCKICQIEDIVSKKPLRYESRIYESSVSGGEKQRILLARTLMKPASLYLFDEPLSEVEEKMEKEIIKGIRKKLKGKTIVYISHRNCKEEFERNISFYGSKRST